MPDQPDALNNGLLKQGTRANIIHLLVCFFFNKILTTV